MISNTAFHLKIDEIFLMSRKAMKFIIKSNEKICLQKNIIETISNNNLPPPQHIILIMSVLRISTLVSKLKLLAKYLTQ